MYHYIKGKYTGRGDSFAIIENSGIGYKIFTSESNIKKLSDSNSEITLYTYLNVREDAMDLYGFLTNDELSMFLQLISVSRVGPKAALAITNVVSPSQFALAIITNDTAPIVRAAGIGTKVAQRIILELKDKIKTTDATNFDKSEYPADNTSYSEALNALIVLGYSEPDAKKALSSIKSDNTENMIKEALKHLISPL